MMSDTQKNEIQKEKLLKKGDLVYESYYYNGRVIPYYDNMGIVLEIRDCKGGRTHPFVYKKIRVYWTLEEEARWKYPEHLIKIEKQEQELGVNIEVVEEDECGGSKVDGGEKWKLVVVDAGGELIDERI